MSIAPWRQLFVMAQVFIANVDAARPRYLAIHHHNLAVITEVDLEPIAKTLRRVESGNLHATIAKTLQVCQRKLLAANFVVKKINPDTLVRFFYQAFLDASAQVVIHKSPGRGMTCRSSIARADWMIGR